MAAFDLKALVAKYDQENQIRVGRSILPLMVGRTSTDHFECRLAPVAFGLSSSQLKDSVDRMMHTLHLDEFASVTLDAQGKVALVIPASAMAPSHVQSNISTLLAETHQKASQLSI